MINACEMCQNKDHRLNNVVSAAGTFQSKESSERTMQRIWFILILPPTESGSLLCGIIRAAA